MADLKISAMTDAAVLTGAELFEVVQGGATFKATVTQVSTFVIAAIPTATGSVAGLMSGADKTKLDGVAVSANNYVLPAAGASIGGVKIAAAVTDIATPASATAEEIANKVNALLASLRTAGTLA